MTKCDLNIQGENMHEMAGRSEMSARFDGLLPNRQPAREDVRHFQERMQRKSGGEAATADTKKVDRSAPSRQTFPSAPAIGSFWERIFGRRERSHSGETANEGRSEEATIRSDDWNDGESAVAGVPGDSGERPHGPLDGSQVKGEGSSGSSISGDIVAAVSRDGSGTTDSTARTGAPVTRVAGHGRPSGETVTRPIFMGPRTGDGRLISRGGIATSRATMGRPDRLANSTDIDPFFSQNPPVRTASIRGRNLERYGALPGLDLREPIRPIRFADPLGRQTAKNRVKDSENGPQETPRAKVQGRTERLPEGKGSSGSSISGDIVAAVSRDGSGTTDSTARTGAPVTRVAGHGRPSGETVTRPIFMGPRTGDGRLISRGGIATSRATMGRSNRRDDPDDIDPFFSQNPPVRTASIRGRNLDRYGALPGLDLREPRRPIRFADPLGRQTAKNRVKDSENGPQETPRAKVQGRTERLPEVEGRRASEKNLPPAAGERNLGQVTRHQSDSENRDSQKSVKELRKTGETLDLSSGSRQDDGVKTLTSLSLAEDRYAARSTKIENLLGEKSQFQFDRRTFDRRRTRGVEEPKKHDDSTDLIVGLPQPNFLGVAAIQRPSAAADLPQQSLRELCQQLVDQITVHQALLDLREEVHVQLKGPLFAGSEVVISRDTNGVLLVNFTVVDDQAGSLLVHNQQGLRDHLQEMLDLDTVRIEVQDQRGRSGEEDATNQGQQRQGERRHSDQESPEKEVAKIVED